MFVEAAAKKGGKGAKKDRSPSGSAAKKGSPKATSKKGKKGNIISSNHIESISQVHSDEEPSPVAAPVPTEPQGPPPPKPGSEEWIYVQEPIDLVSIFFYSLLMLHDRS